MAMKRDIAAWDGKATDPIAAVYARHNADKGFLAEAIALCADAACARGATWLLKRWLEDGRGPVAAALTHRLLTHLGTLAHWEAKLHVLQALPHLTIAPDDAPAVARFVATCLGDEATFVRAWAYTGLHHLAVQHPAYREDAQRTLETAMTVAQPASVRVRLRKALAAGF